MAVVYKAVDSVLGRTVALKTLHQSYAEIPSFRRRFRQEARAMASLDHQNVVKVFDICEDDGRPFIVAEHVAGRDLGKILSGRRDGLDERFVEGVAAQLLRALSYAHRQGIIHRDIKPSNILIAPGGTVKVADFGIARILEDEDAASGAPGEIVGSARYMSPEQLRGEEATPRSDVYSVGILLYHCLTGRPPFSGDVKALARQHLREKPTPPRKLNRGISPRMEAVVLRALKKNPDDRYPSATAMLDDMEARGHRTAVAKGPEPRAAGGANRGRRVGLVLASLLGLLVLLGGGAALASGLGYMELPARLAAQSGGGAETAAGQSNPVESADAVEGAEPPATPQEPAGQGQPSRGPGEGDPPQDAVSGRGQGSDARSLAPVPDVTAYYDYYARRTLVSSGFDVRFVYDYQRGFAPRGVAWATEPAVGSLAPLGSTITVYATPEDLPQPVF